MCLFQKEVTTAGAPSIAPRADKDIGLAEGRDTKGKEEVTSIKYGNSKKDTGSAAAKKTGTDALTINLNQNQGGSTTGGMNV
mgnify:CR=1 FL=1|tara:strand:- start:191 stop:436 length:246 start_codon:yes stop_codon:yes gene_type:complete